MSTLRGLGLGAALGDQRDRARDAARAGGDAHARARAPEPRLEREVRRAQSLRPCRTSRTGVEPFSCRPSPALADGVAVTVADAGEAWPAVSTATTT